MAVTDERLAQYLTGEVSAAERAEVEAWAAADPRHARVLASMSAAWTAQERPRYDVESGIRVILARGNDAPESAYQWPIGRRQQAWNGWRSVSVGAALLAATMVVAWGVASGRSRPQAFREFTTAPGGRTTVTLRDGTSFMLGPATRLRVADDFGVHTRIVDLDGSAEFTVVPDAARPFTVRTEHAVTRDIGTRFVVQAYRGDLEMRVAVAEGEVAVTPMRGSVQSSELRLGAGSALQLGLDGLPVVRRNVSVAGDFAWMQSNLSFDGAPLRDVLRTLARTFNVDITLADSTLASKRITSEFRQESADEILYAVTRAVGAHYERTGRHIVVQAGLAKTTGKSQASVVPLNTVQANSPSMSNLHE